MLQAIEETTLGHSNVCETMDLSARTISSVGVRVALAIAIPLPAIDTEWAPLSSPPSPSSETPVLRFQIFTSRNPPVASRVVSGLIAIDWTMSK